MTKIYLIRHAEAEGNYYRRIQGHWDGGITRRGRLQIDALAERMKDVPIHALYSSDLRRTMLTAGAIQKYHDLPLVTDPRLREVYVGRWEGVSWGDAAWHDAQQYRYFSTNPDLWQIEGSESWAHLQNRIHDALLDIAAQHEGQTIAVVAHGTIIRSLMCKLWGVPGKDINTVPHGDNTCVSTLVVENGVITVADYANSDHLTGNLKKMGGQNWWKTGKDKGNLHFRPLDWQTEARFYIQCYADSWRIAHGDLDSFFAAGYLGQAHKWLKANPEAIAVAMDEDTVVGLVALDTTRGEPDEPGWIGFLYILPEHRGKKYGTQLIGYADMLYTRLGRKSIGLSVSVDNPNAIDFYDHLGFLKYGEALGVGSMLWLMKKPIGQGVLQPLF